jgi:DNA polymerase bacteriophage-type
VLNVILDYETRSKVNLEASGAIVYARHPSTSIFCLGYKINDAPPKIWIPELAPMPADLWECFQRGTLVAQNAAFERAITKYTLTRYKCLTAKQRRTLAAL